MRLSADKSLNMLCMRRTDISFTVTSAFKPNMTTGECGIMLFQNDDNYLAFACCDHTLQVIKMTKGKKEVITSQAYNGSLLQVQLCVKGQKGQFLLCGKKVGEEINLTYLSPEEAGGFTGNCIGMYTNGELGYADFVFFEYENK